MKDYLSVTLAVAVVATMGSMVVVTGGKPPLESPRISQATTV